MSDEFTLRKGTLHQCMSLIFDEISVHASIRKRGFGV